MLPQKWLKVALIDSSCKASRKIMDIEGDSVDDANEDGSDDDSENEDSPVVPDNVPDDKAETDKIDVTRENILQSTLVLFSLHGSVMNKSPLCPWDPCFLTPALLWFHWGTRCAYIC